MPSGGVAEKVNSVVCWSRELNVGVKRSPVVGFLSWAKVMLAGSRNFTVAEGMLPA